MHVCMKGHLWTKRLSEEQGERNWQKAYTTLMWLHLKNIAEDDISKSRGGKRLEENGSHRWHVFWGVPHIFVLRKQSINKIKSLSKIYSEVNSLHHDKNLSFAEWVSLLAKHG